MKVDFVSALFGKPGGGENATRTLAETLIEQGVDVRVVGTRSAARAFPYASVLPGTDRIPAMLVTYGWNPLLDRLFERRLLEYLQSRRPDVVVLEDHMLFVAAAAAVKRYNADGGNAKVVMSQIWDVDTSFFYEFRARPLAWWMHRHFSRLNAMARDFDLVNAYVPFHRSELIRLFHTDPEKIVTVQTTTVEVSHLPRPATLEGRPTFVAPGRICPEKGCFFLLDAIEVLRRRTHDFTVEFYGTGPSERKLRREIARRGLSENAVVKGVVPREQLWEAMPRAVATCVPIMYPPGYTCVALESLGAGVPLIVFDHGAVRDLIENGKTGYAVPPRDAAAYAEAMHEFVKNPNSSLAMELACRQKLVEVAPVRDGAAALMRTFTERFGNGAARA
ncbi:MAG: glycosyltransferase family 4 protein [Candidatus Eremiobacteraeota bacterium]|nr:glycosyltransferase family 4 protein [Candidatus Eremiobacteraeota bacterium]